MKVKDLKEFIENIPYKTDDTDVVVKFYLIDENEVGYEYTGKELTAFYVPRYNQIKLIVREMSEIKEV